MVERRRDLNPSSTNERPSTVRQRKLDLAARVNGDVALDFSDVALTSYAGLELFGRYLRQTRFNALVREVFRGTPTWGDYGLVAMVRLLVGLLVVGGRRLRHVAYVADDPLFRRFTGLRRLPTACTVSRWLKAFTMTTVGRLQDLNAGVVARVLPTLGLGTVTIDVDGVVVSTGHHVERAFRGFNPHPRKVPSYYPILAHVAETTHILRVKNRSGNVHDGKASLAFLRELWGQLVVTLGRRRSVRFRMDGAFFGMMWCAGCVAGPSGTPSRCPSTPGWICRPTFGASARGRQWPTGSAGLPCATPSRRGASRSRSRSIASRFAIGRPRTFNSICSIPTTGTSSTRPSPATSH